MKVTYAKAIGDALCEEMRRDDKVLIFGEDVAQFGNIFGITRGMLEEFGPKRVRNTPITETAIVGTALGAALTGLRPVAELMYSDFTMCAFTEIFHWTARIFSLRKKLRSTRLAPTAVPRLVRICL